MDQRVDAALSPEKPPTGCNLIPEDDRALPSLPPARLAGKITPDGYRPENWQWVDVLTEPHPLGWTDKGGQVRAVGRDPMTYWRRQVTPHARLGPS
jgi:hypothetical protein